MEEQPPVEEVMIAQWEQPKRAGLLSSKAGTSKLLLIALPVAAVFVIGAIWLREINFGLAALVIIVAVIAIQAQNRNAALPIALTTTRVVIGKRAYALTDLAGFWLADLGDAVEINLENNKPGLIPTTFLFSSPSIDEARDTFAEVLPELEPREKKIGDKLNSYLKL